jgi:hypothetical protein
MKDNQQQEGVLIRHWFERDELHLVLEEFSEDIAFDLSGEIREITLKGVGAEQSLREGLEKSRGENLWLSINDSTVVIGAEFMPEQELRHVHLTVIRRPYKLDDLSALYAVTQSVLVNFRSGYGIEYKKRTNLEARVSKFIESRRERLHIKLDFLKERDPTKAARIEGMLEILDELAADLASKEQ